MSKLNAPLFSFGASGAIAKALVYFTWKGLDVVRSYVVPANPKTTGQNTQRGYLKSVVDAIHTAQGLAADALGLTDQVAYALWGSCEATPRTWFNQIVKNALNQNVAALKRAIAHGFVLTPGATKVTVKGFFTPEGANDVTTIDVYYGTSKTALTSKSAFTKAELNAGKDITSLTTGVKYYFQARPTAHADFVGVRSGIYYAVAG